LGWWHLAAYPFYLLALGNFVRMAWAPREWIRSQLEDTTWKARMGQHKVISADPMWAHLGLCFCMVVVLWVLRSVPCVHPSLRQFACPWALQSLWHPRVGLWFVRVASLGLVTMACMHRILGGSPSLAELMWHGP
jgi:hypothetical protein